MAASNAYVYRRFPVQALFNSAGAAPTETVCISRVEYTPEPRLFITRALQKQEDLHFRLFLV